LQPQVGVIFVHSTVATHNLVVNIVDYVALWGALKMTGSLFSRA